MKFYCNPMGTFPENHIFEPNSVLAIPMAWRTSPLHFAPQATYIPNGALKSASFDFFWDTSMSQRPFTVSQRPFVVSQRPFAVSQRLLEDSENV